MYRVLVVDDEPIERLMLSKTLEKLVGDSCQIFEAQNGREAVEIFEEEKIQIAILDVEMPGINGLEAARMMREINDECVIIFITAFDDFLYAKQAISVHAIDYILKPYESKEVVYAIEEGKLGGLAVDVYSVEPFPEEHPYSRIFGKPNVMNAAWGTMFERDQVILNLTESHKTVKNICRQDYQCL